MTEYLDRRRITGGLNLQSPACVLIEVARAHNLVISTENLNFRAYRTLLIKSIDEQTIPTVKSPYTSDDISDIAVFVNIDREWTQSRLLKSFTNLLRQIQLFENETFINEEHQPPERKEFSNVIQRILTLSPNDVGDPTPNDGDKLTVGFLYRLCIEEELIVGPRTSPEELLKILQSFYRGTSLYPDVFTIFKSKISLNASTNPTCVNKANLYVLPVDETETLRLVAKRFEIDLTVGYPHHRALDEYYEYLITGRYSFIEQLRSRNPNLGSVRTYFSPNLPPDVYRSEDVISMLRNEGFSSRELKNMNSKRYLEYLQSISLLDSFHAGYHPTIQNSSTPISLDEVDELSNDRIICYGVRIENLIAYTYRELADTMFQRQERVISIEKRYHLLGDREARKLYILSNIQTSDPDASSDRQFLRSVLAQLQDNIHRDNEQINEFVHIYKLLDKQEQIGIQESFRKLLELSMTIRGWKGNGPFPIKTADGYSQIIETRITDAIFRLHEQCQFSYTKSKIDITKLPLLRHTDEKYQVIGDLRNGRTIGDRLRIVGEGITSSNVMSCVRMSSNVFIYTSLYYLSLFGVTVGFRPRDLTTIA